MKLWPFIDGAAAAAAFVIALVGLRLSRCSFTCKACGKTFHIPWRRALWVQHYNNEYILRCPHCGHKGWCVAVAPSEKEGN